MVKKRKSTSKEEASSKEPKPEPKIEKPPPPPPSSSSSDESDSDSSESEGVKTKKQSEEEEVEEEEEEELSSSESSSSEEEEEEEEEDSKLKKIKNLLEPFGKEQLINILKDAATTNPSILSGIIASAESNPVHRKIFVHGLSWDATNETLSAVFKQYGPIEECNVITDKVTGRSKGYGFVLFQTHAGARKALKQPEKKIGSRMAACQLASTGPVQNNNHNQQQQQQQQQKQKQQGSDASLRKLYVANVGAQINPEKLRAFLAKFGEIEDGPLGIDKVTGKFRGYAIFVYKTLEGIKKALEEPVKVFDGVKMQCSVAVEKKSAKNNVAAGGGSNVAATGANAAVVQGNVAMPGLPVTLNQGLADQNLNPGVVFMGQNPVLGVLNPVLGLGGVGPSGMMNQMVLNPPFPGGVLQSLNRVGSHPMNPPMGLSAGFGVQPPINSISPSVVSNYGSQAVVQGMGAYQGPQLGQSSDLGAAVAARPNASVPPHLGR